MTNLDEHPVSTRERAQRIDRLAQIAEDRHTSKADRRRAHADMLALQAEVRAEWAGRTAK